MSGWRQGWGLPRTLRMFAAAVVVDAVGTGLYLAGAAIFAVRAVGLSTVEVGGALAVAGLVGFIATAPLGAIGGRIDPLLLLRFYQGWRALAFVCLAFTDGLVGFTLASMAVAAVSWAVVPLNQCVVGAAVSSEQRTQVMALFRSLRNVGFSIGALAAAPMIAIGSDSSLRAIVLINAATFLVAVVLLGRLGDVPKMPLTMTNPLMDLARFRDVSYLGLAAGNCLLALHISMLSIGIPMWTLQHTQAPASLVAIMIVTNTVMAFFLQVPLTVRSGTSPRAMSRTIWRAGMSLVACSAALALAAHLPIWGACAVLLVATVFLTFGEIWQAAAEWETSFRFAPEHERPVYLSVFSLGGAAQQVVGPLVITSVVIANGSWGWAALCLAFIVACAFATRLVRRLDARTTHQVTLAKADHLA